MSSVVNVTMLLSSKDDYKECNEEYVKWWPAESLPTRATALWGVPTEAKVGFSCIALEQGGGQ